ncbi:galanin receptor type 1-like [Arapaima gigas]
MLERFLEKGIVYPADAFSSLSILRALRQSRPGEGMRDEISLLKKRAFRMVSVIQLLTVFSCLPIIFCCICMERYFAVVHPVVFLKYKATWYRLACLASVWLLTVVFCTVRIFDQSYYISGSVVLAALAVDTFCSLSILKVLRKPQPGDVAREQLNLMKRSAFRTVLVIQVMMVVNYLPVLIVTPLEKYKKLPCAKQS